ncbi:hypothetical protein FSP39_002423 [Pinctada imbricata]|uniref:Uncharacterized protein n=1 Tax=Pinctada imbricata TaxID=66713 RepID=A0AA88YLT5_PINIB|nr:hypothetical protein FSP39_002423 [Pinctada imbricata]
MILLLYHSLFCNSNQATYVVPESCCITNVKVTDCENAARNPKSPNLSSMLHNKGCLTEIGDILKQNITIVIGVAIGIAMIQLLGIVLACRVWRSSDDVDKVY